METKAHHALVGLFAVLLIAALTFFSFWLGDRIGDREFSTYDIIFEGAVSGLREASEVRFNGIRVGEVTTIGLDPQDRNNRVIARVRVFAETPVKVDSYAVLEPLGLTGLSYVQITGGSPNAEMLDSPPFQPPPRVYARRGQLDELTEGAEDVLESAQIALIRISTLLSEDNIDEVSQTIANVEAITARLAEEDALIEDFRAAVARFEVAAVDISAAAERVESLGIVAEAMLTDEVGPAMRNTAIAAASVDQAARDFDGLIRAVEPALEGFAEDGLDELTLAAGDLRRLIDTLDRIATEIENNPASFVAGDNRERVEIPQ